jgi:hypothetical protein
MALALAVSGLPRVATGRESAARIEFVGGFAPPPSLFAAYENCGACFCADPRPSVPPSRLPGLNPSQGFRSGSKGMAMAYLDVSRVTSWHAHVYFDAASRDAAKEPPPGEGPFRRRFG